MAGLRRTFGRLVAAHRRRLGITQDELAQRAEISVDMVSKLETGAAGARFPVIERLAVALDVHPAELFTAEVVADRLRKPVLRQITETLVELNEAELIWIKGVIDASLKAPR